MLEIEREEADFARNGRTRRLPAESAGNHEVKYEKEFTVSFDHDPFAETPQAHDCSALDG